MNNLKIYAIYNCFVNAGNTAMSFFVKLLSERHSVRDL